MTQFTDTGSFYNNAYGRRWRPAGTRGRSPAARRGAPPGRPSARRRRVARSPRSMRCTCPAPRWWPCRPSCWRTGCGSWRRCWTPAGSSRPFLGFYFVSMHFLESARVRPQCRRNSTCSRAGMATRDTLRALGRAAPARHRLAFCVCRSMEPCAEQALEMQSANEVEADTAG